MERQERTGSRAKVADIRHATHTTLPWHVADGVAWSRGRSYIGFGLGRVSVALIEHHIHTCIHTNKFINRQNRGNESEALSMSMSVVDLYSA